jgi:hypothetical protein
MNLVYIKTDADAEAVINGHMIACFENVVLVSLYRIFL